MPSSKDFDIGRPGIIKFRSYFVGESRVDGVTEAYFVLPLGVIVQKLGRNRQNTTN